MQEEDVEVITTSFRGLHLHSLESSVQLTILSCRDSSIATPSIVASDHATTCVSPGTPTMLPIYGPDISKGLLMTTSSPYK